MPLILPGNVASATSGGFSVDNSCRFDRASSIKLERTPGSAGNRRTFTFSCWFKLGNLASSVSDYIQIFGGFDGAGNEGLFISDADQFYLYMENTNALISNLKLRDPSAWYHVVMAVDTTNGTADNRCRLYLNGSEITSFSARSNPTQNYDSGVNNTVVQNIGERIDDDYFDGYMAEVVLIDGLQLTPTSFGEFDEDSPTIWKPIDVSGLTFGTNGFYLSFSDSADLGADSSGNSNDFTSTNLAATDQATDTPTNNFCTMNPLVPTTNITFSEGNCKMVTHVSSDTYGGGIGTFGLTAGKWYWEIKMASLLGNHTHGVISELTAELYQNVTGLHNDTGVTTFWNDDGGEMIKDGSYTTADYGTLDDGDILGIAFNADDNEISFYDNGALIVDGYTISTTRGTLFPLITTGINTTSEVNFGGCSGFTVSSAANDENGYGVFEIAPPSGYLALCSKNLGSDGG